MPRASLLSTGLAAACLWSGGAARAQTVESRPAPTTDESPAQLSDAVVARLLDEPVALSLESRPLPEVLDAITERTAVPFSVPPETYAVLPYGDSTPISVSVSSTPLRQTLSAIQQRLGLRYTLRDGRVVFRPVPALTRGGDRATVEEIALLDLLGTMRLDLVEDRPTVAQLLETIDLRLEAVDTAARQAGRQEPGYVVDNRLPDSLRERPVFVSRDATLAAAAEAIALQTAATWYLEKDTLVVLPKSDWVLRRLERPVTLAYDSVELQQVIDDLERLAGVRFYISPGALGRVPAKFQQVRLFLEEATVRQALESIGGQTGLAYEVAGDGIYLEHVDNTGEDARRPRTPIAGFRGAEQPVLLVDMGDGTSLLVYESELPREARERLERRRREVVDAIVRDQPTTRPSPE